MPLLTLLDLARKQPGFPRDAAGWKLIVHTSDQVELPDLVYGDLPTFEYFQRDHNRHVYNCQHIVSTVKLSSRTALVIGAYDVGESAPLDLTTVQPPPVLKPSYVGWRESENPQAIRYELTPNAALAELAFRVIIDVPPRGMKLNHLGREVVGLREAGCVGPCPDYQDIDLSLSRLQAIYAKPEANSDWRARLSAVDGIYLLTDHKNHRLYVGKTESRQGFWDRWRDYDKQKTGNTLVDPAFASGALQPEHATMSILQVIPRGSATKSRIQTLESRWMRRLQSREVGYNGSTGNQKGSP